MCSKKRNPSATFHSIPASSSDIPEAMKSCICNVSSNSTITP